MKDWRLVVAFDTDDTLLVPNVALNFDYEVWSPHYENIEAYKWFQNQGCYMIIWSGTGTDWAERWAKEFGLTYDEIRVKQKCDDIDLSIDDCNVDLAKVNLKVKRVNNSISRKEWNKTKHT